MYAIKDVAQKLGISRQAVSKWIAEGKLEVYRTITNRVRISEQEYIRVTTLR